MWRITYKSLPKSTYQKVKDFGGETRRLPQKQIVQVFKFKFISFLPQNSHDVKQTIKIKELIWQGRLGIDLSVFKVCSHPNYQLNCCKLVKNTHHCHEACDEFHPICNTNVLYCALKFCDRYLYILYLANNFYMML